MAWRPPDKRSALFLKERRKAGTAGKSRLSPQNHQASRTLNGHPDPIPFEPQFGSIMKIAMVAVQALPMSMLLISWPGPQESV